jgi:hypothetical protein
MSSMAALVLPECDSAQRKGLGLGPSLKRGEGPRQPRGGWQKSFWPHLPKTRFEEVPVGFPLVFQARKRVLVLDEAQTAGKSLPTMTSSPSSPAVLDVSKFGTMTKTAGACEDAGLMASTDTGRAHSTGNLRSSRGLGSNTMRRRPRGGPLNCGSLEYSSSLSGDMASGIFSPSSSKPMPLSLAPVPTTELSLSKPHTVHLEGWEPPGSPTQAQSSTAGDGAQISGRPLFKGQIRT